MAPMDAYEKFDFEQFVEDPKFRNWVLAPTEEEDVFWQNFLTIYPHQDELVNEAKAFLQGTKEYFDRQGASNRQISQQIAEVLQRVDDNDAMTDVSKVQHRTKPRRESTESNRKTRIIRLVSIAASLAILLGAGGWFWTYQMGAGTLYATDFGEWKTIDLPDGSTVQLNANSQLRLDKNWSEGEDREVFLQGEAFFEVSKKPTTGAKFKVVTNDLAVEVLGTAFNVLSRGEKTEVFLQEGKVKLELGEEDTVGMLPGDFVAYSGAKEKIIDRYRRDNETEVSPDTWKDGVLMFKSEYAFPILKKLEEIYGVQMEVKNEAIYTKKYSVNVPMEDLTVVIGMLEKSMDVKITHEDKRLILDKKE